MHNSAPKKTKPWLEELEGLSEHLRMSATAGNTTLHFQHADQADRLSRRIRLGIGNPFNVTLQLREEIAQLFQSIAEVIDPSVTGPRDRLASTALFADNLRTRADHLINPEKVERELFGDDFFCK